MSQCGLLYARASQARPQHPAPGGGSARHSPVCPATAGGRVWSLHHEPVSPHSAHWVIAVSPPEGAGCFLGFPFGLRGAESAPASWGRVLPGGRQCVARAERRAGQGLRVQPAGWVSAHFGPLLSEVALAVDFKEEVSWQKEKIEGVVQFPPINNPGGHGYLLVGGSACSPGGSSESSPSVGAVISEVPRPHMKGLTGHLHHHLGRGQSGPPSPGAHRRQRLGLFWEAGRQHGGIGALPWPGTWAVNSRGASFLMGVKRLHWEGAGPQALCGPAHLCPVVLTERVEQRRVWQNASSRWALVLFTEPGEQSPDLRPGTGLSSAELSVTPISGKYNLFLNVKVEDLFFSLEIIL